MFQQTLFKNTCNLANDFDKIDANSDGSISLPEFLKWRQNEDQQKSISNLQYLLLPSLHQTFLGLFKSYDINVDGHLSVPEFVPLVYALSRSPTSEAEKFFQV